jgi:glycosyltransferase 2 family protein
MALLPELVGRPRARWRIFVRVGFLVGFMGGLAWSLTAQWPVVGPLLGRVSPPELGVALVLVLAGIFAMFACWRALLANLGGELPLAAAIRVFFLGQLGKYLPGSVWPAMVQMELGRDYQIPERASGAAVGVCLPVVVGTAWPLALPSSRCWEPMRSVPFGGCRPSCPWRWWRPPRRC